MILNDDIFIGKPSKKWLNTVINNLQKQPCFSYIIISNTWNTRLFFVYIIGQFDQCWSLVSWWMFTMEWFFFWSLIYRNTSSYAPFTCVTLDNMHFLIVPENTVQGLNHWSWKQTNVSFEAFLVGNQGWHIKSQMLR